MRRPLVALALALALPVPVLAGQVVVREGESLSEIADRHGISISRLIELNGIRNPDMVEAGSLLRIPGGSGGGSSSRTSSGGRSVASGGRIVVQEGDTLSEIASRHGVSMATLMKANGLASPDLVEAGRSLVLPGAGGSSRPQGGRSTAAAPAAPFTYNPRARNHVVRSGESLSTIADGYGIPMERLVALNSLKDPDMVPAGLQLKLRPEPVAPQPPVRPRTAVRPTTPRPAATTARVQPSAPRPAVTTARRPQVSSSGSPAVASTSVRPASPRTSAVVSAAAANRPSRPVASPLASAAIISRPSRSTSPAISPTSINLASGTASRPTSLQRNNEPSVSSHSAAAATTTATTASAATVTAATATTATRPFTTNTLASSGPVLARASTPTSSNLLSSSTRTPTSSTRPGAASSSAAAPTTGAASTNTTIAMASRPDWRTYGPLQVDWANWQPMGGSVVAPTLSSEGQSQYLAINCNARKMNTTSRSGQWNSWSDPRSDFEQQLLTDACKPRS